MRKFIGKLKSDYLEQASLSIFSLVVGLLLADLLNEYLNYFILLLVITGAFLIIYYKQTQRIGTIRKILSNQYGKRNGSISYFSDPKDLYKAGAEYLLNAKREILIYNDYFGQKSVIMGYNTTNDYFKTLENRIRKLGKDPNFKMMCIIGANTIKSANLADKYKEHLKSLFVISNQFKRDSMNNISPFIYADKRTIYTSFTIIDGEILRIALEGIYVGEDKISSKVIGGFIIEDNEEIINYFRNLFLHTAGQSRVFESFDEISDAI